jgi:hypothetical protein
VVNHNERKEHRNPRENHKSNDKQAKNKTKIRKDSDGFTQTWHTVGAGTTSHDGESLTREERNAPAMKLSVRLRGKQLAREKEKVLRKANS